MQKSAKDNTDMFDDQMATLIFWAKFQCLWNYTAERHWKCRTSFVWCACVRTRRIEWAQVLLTTICMPCLYLFARLLASWLAGSYGCVRVCSACTGLCCDFCNERVCSFLNSLAHYISYFFCCVLCACALASSRSTNSTADWISVTETARLLRTLPNFM